MFGRICPICSQEIEASRALETASGTTLVCTCGYSDSNAQMHADRSAEKRTITAFMIVCALILVGFAHLVNWGGYALSMPFRQMARMTGTISPQGLEHVIQACFDRSKWDCVQDAHGELYQKTKNPEVLARLAHFRERLNRTEDARLTYDWYLRAGGQNAEALFRYADLLENAGDSSKALELYVKSIAAAGERLPVRAMTGLLRILMNEGRNQEAFDHLQAFYSSAGNAKDYFGSEYQSLENSIKRGKRVAKR